MDPSQTYFAYGSNMSTIRLQERIPEAVPAGRAQWPGMRLVFNKVAADGSGKANLVADASSIAWGVLFTIPEPHFATLDEFEPGYRRTGCTLALDDGREVCSQVYLARPPFSETPPHDWYREHLLRGALEHALPEDVVQLIRTLQLG